MENGWVEQMEYDQAVSKVLPTAIVMAGLMVGYSADRWGKNMVGLSAVMSAALSDPYSADAMAVLMDCYWEKRKGSMKVCW
jgi:hypothetical protein